MRDSSVFDTGTSNRSGVPLYLPTRTCVRVTHTYRSGQWVSTDRRHGVQARGDKFVCAMVVDHPLKTQMLVQRLTISACMNHGAPDADELIP